MWIALPVKATPDFSRSLVRATPESPVEGSIVDFEIVLRNTGDTDADVVNLRIRWPEMGYLIESSQLKGGKRDEVARELEGYVSLPAGGEHTIRLKVLAPNDAGGHVLSVMCQADHYASGTQTVQHGMAVVDTRPRTDGIALGGTRVTLVGLLVLAWLFAGVCLFLGLKIWVARSAARMPDNRRTGSAAALKKRAGVMGIVVSIMLPLGFWLMFALMAWRDYQVLSVWTKTKGTVVGRRENIDTFDSSPALRPADGPVPLRPSRADDSATTVTPEFAIRYRFGDQERYSTGYDTGTSLHIGGRVTREQEMREWVRGAEIPVWVNPRDPQEIVVRPGFGGAYFFALLPIPVFWLGVRAWQSLRASLRPVALPGDHR